MKKYFKNALPKLTHGFMMVEVLFAVSIISLAMISAMTVAQKASHVARQAVHTAQATTLLEEGAEAVRILRDNSWANIAGLDEGTDYYPLFTDGTWLLSQNPSAIGIFARTVQINAVERDGSTGDITESGTEDPGTKLITVTVSWLEGGATVSKNLEFYISDIFS